MGISVKFTVQVDNAYNEFEGKVVVDLGCGTVSRSHAAWTMQSLFVSCTRV